MVRRSSGEVLMDNKVARTYLRRADFEQWGLSEGFLGAGLSQNWSGTSLRQGWHWDDTKGGWVDPELCHKMYTREPRETCVRQWEGTHQDRMGGD